MDNFSHNNIAGQHGSSVSETFNILINYSDAGAKRKKRLKILLIIAGIVLLLGVIAAVVAVVVVKNTSTNSSSDKLLNLDNDTLLLIGGKNSDNDFVNDVEAVGIKDCPKIKQLPDIDHNLKSLSTLIMAMIQPKFILKFSLNLFLRVTIFPASLSSLSSISKVRNGGNFKTIFRLASSMVKYDALNTNL